MTFRQVATWVGIAVLSSIVIWILKRLGIGFLKSQGNLNRWEAIQEYRSVLWFQEKPERFYRHALATLLFSVRWAAAIGVVMSVAVILYPLPWSKNAKENIVAGTSLIAFFICNFIFTRCKYLERTARRLDRFAEYRAKVPTDVVKEVENDPASKESS